MSESERTAFEAWMRQTNGPLRDFDLKWYESDGSYDNTGVNAAWNGWQARASLAEGKAEPAPDDAAVQAARADAADFILGLLVIADHITREQASQARDIARDVGKYPTTAADAAMSPPLAGGKE